VADSLLQIIAAVRRRWRLKLAMRGAARVAVVALVLLLIAAWGLEWARFTSVSIIAARVGLVLALLASIGWFIVRPLRRRVTDEQVALYLEEHEPRLQATLISAVEASRAGRPVQSSALVNRLVEQAIERCAELDAAHRVEQTPLRRWGAVLGAVAVAAALAILVGPAFIRNAVSAMLLVSRDVEAAAPYRIEVKPGNAKVPKGADQSVTAMLSGFDSDDVMVMAQRTPGGKYEAVPLVKQGSGYEGMLFDVMAPLKYYVEARGVKSAEYTLTVVDLPYVQRMDLEYRFPAYTGMEPEKVEDGGDIAVLRGTEVRVHITPTMKTQGGRIALNDKDSVPLTLESDGTLSGAFKADRDGFYRVELQAPTGEKVTASPQYTIDVLADQAPTVTFRKPGRDTSVSPIEELFVEANADDDYGVRDLELVYSVNGGPEKTVKLFDGQKRLTEVTAGHTFYLEEMNVQPGDSVSYYARAADNDGVAGAKKASSDLYFLRVRPFKKDFRQAQSQGGGGGGGGGGAGGQVEALSEQQRQIISATFNVQRDRKTFTADKLRQNSTVVGLNQGRLREQVETLLTRMNSDLVQRDPAFEKIGELLPQAVAAMKEAEGKLSAAAPDAALPSEHKALQILQKAEEEYQTQVSVQRQQGGGGGGGGQMQQELADIFEQELDKMASRYETANQASEQQKDRQVDDLLEKLKELARRQEQEAERQRRRALEGQSASGGGSGAQQRALADQVEEAARRLEKLAREEQREDLADAARQMRDAANAMRRAAAGGDANAQAQAQAALERLRDTEKKLQRTQQQRAERDIQDAKQQADEIAREQQEISEMARQLGTMGSGTRAQQNQQLSTRKESLEAKLGQLENDLDRAARDASKDQKNASRKMADAASALRDQRLRDQVRYSRQLVNRGAPSQTVNAAEGNITRGIDDVRKKLDEAEAALNQNNGTAPGDRREQALERAQRLARGLESLQERTRERGQRGQQGRDGQGSDQQNRQQAQRGQQGQGQQGQRGQQGQQGQAGQQGQQGQQGQGGGDQQNAQNQQGGQGGGGRMNNGPRDGNGNFNGRVGDYAGGVGTEYGWGGWWDGRNWRLSPEDIRQLRGEMRQWESEARDLRGLLPRGEFDPKQLDEVLRTLRELQDDRVYQNAQELQRLQSYVTEQLKRIEFNLRRQVDEQNSVALSGSEEVPEQFRTLVEQYYRSLARSSK
jgi:hypothetical protein